jgi:hypothetical protein
LVEHLLTLPTEVLQSVKKSEVAPPWCSNWLREAVLVLKLVGVVMSALWACVTVPGDGPCDSSRETRKKIFSLTKELMVFVLLSTLSLAGLPAAPAGWNVEYGNPCGAECGCSGELLLLLRSIMMRFLLSVVIP